MRLSGQKKEVKKKPRKGKTIEVETHPAEETAVPRGLSYSVTHEVSSEILMEESVPVFTEEGVEGPKVVEEVSLEADANTNVEESAPEDVQQSVIVEETPKAKRKSGRSKKAIVIDDDEDELAEIDKKQVKLKGAITFKDVILSLIETVVAACILGVVGYQLGSLYLGELLQGIFGL